jgi:putative ABC transport system ATP-binding protein
MITVKKLTKSYTLNQDQQETVVTDPQSLILQNVDWAVAEKKFVALFGKSGSGKSTFLNVISGIDKPDSGQVFFGDIDLYSLSDFELSQVRLKYFGFIFQTFNLISTLSAEENIEYPLVLLKVPEMERRQRTQQYINSVGLSGFEKKMPSQLSGGQRQRVAIARALVKNPKIIFADEPTANLDENTADEVLQLLVDLQHQNKATIVYVTHDQDVMRFAESRFLLSHRQIRDYSNV